MLILDMLYIGTLLGLYIGVVPVFLGFFFLPILQRLSKEWQTFIVNISVGVLIFLLIDVSSESIELANKLIAGLKIPLDGKSSVPVFDQFLFNLLGNALSEHLGSIILLIGFVIGIFSLVLVDNITSKLSSEDMVENNITTSNLGKKSKIDKILVDIKLKDSPREFSIAYLIAIGIGVHNLGEGLAVGVSYSAGSVTLATVLIFGFAIHNVTEGIAITGPVSKSQVPISLLVVLGLIAGFPTIIGSLLGLLFYSNSLSVFFFAIAAGSLLYVIVIILTSNGEKFALNSTKNFSALLLGFFIMYFTSLLVIL